MEDVEAEHHFTSPCSHPGIMRKRHIIVGLTPADNFLDFLIEAEACWWTIHPASKQRSVGEKVRIGDDLILVSVSSERYLVSLSKSP